MALTILAVDDSATMRRVIEMTFAAENVRVVTIDNGASAVQTALEVKPDVVLADVSLDGVDGYSVAQRIKANPNLSHVRVLLMASQHNAYDEQKGRAAGVDDHIIKPFDTQGLIDRVTRLAGGAAKAVPGAPAAAARPAAPMPPPNTRPQIPLPPSAPAAVPAPPPFTPAAATRSADAPRSQTLTMGSEPPPPATPKRQSVAEPLPAAPARMPHVGAAVSAGMSEKLSGLGLTAAQSEAVLALSREVVERVVWEVVPDLAEAIIREELKRLVSQ